MCSSSRGPPSFRDTLPSPGEEAWVMTRSLGPRRGPIRAGTERGSAIGIRNRRDRGGTRPADGPRVSRTLGHPVRAGLRPAGGRAVGTAVAAQLYRDVHGGGGRVRPFVLPAVLARRGV